MYRNRSQVLVLRPKRQGRLTIGAATLSQGSRLLAQSAPVEIIVRGLQAQAPSAASSDRSLTAEPFILVPRIQRDIQYVGEPFVVEYILLIQDGQRVTDFGMRDVEYPGAIQRESAMEERFERTTPRQIRGKTYAQAIVFREVWKVLQPEVVTAPSQKLVIEVGGRGFLRNRKTLKAPPLKLDVRPVPSRGRPSAYREGAVGRFQIEAILEADDERGRALLDVKISGTGSLRTLDPPQVEVSSATIQALPSDNNKTVTVGKDGVSGSVQFQYLLTPEKVGTVFIKPIELAFFDPDSGAFKTVKTEAQTWNAKTAGPQRVKRPMKQSSSVVDNPTERSLRPIETASLSSDGAGPAVSAQPWYLYTVGGLPALWFCLTVLRLLRRFKGGDSVRARQRRAGLLAQKSLLGLEGALGQGDASSVYAGIAGTLHRYLEDKHGVVTAGSAKHRIVSVLSELGYSDESITGLMRELEACDAARFAPQMSGETELKAAFARAREVIERMEVVP